MFSGQELIGWAGKRWLTWAGVVVGTGLLLYGIYYMADHNLFPTSYDTCDVFDTKEVYSAKIIAKEIRDSNVSTTRIAYPGNHTSTKQSATIKLNETQFVIVNYHYAGCEVVFESAKLARLEQP